MMTFVPEKYIETNIAIISSSYYESLQPTSTTIINIIIINCHRHHYHDNKCQSSLLATLPALCPPFFFPNCDYHAIFFRFATKMNSQNFFITTIPQDDI
mmetsp:Transcript_43204/g.69605  ORF Transcript_43204/g.69605 Transcript_43204/m.69605 type:complete len:99 (+) Transcript_43204:761-1057(+)